MPFEQFNRGQFVQLLLLLLVVPLQYWLTNSSTTDSDRVYEIDRVFSKLSNFSAYYLQLNPWLKWCGEFIVGVWQLYPFKGTPATGDGQTDTVEQPEKFKGHFATSEKPRSPRPAYVQFHVGQVIRHKQWKYRAVIIGWDEVAKAPDRFLRVMHPADKPHWRRLPNYAVLVDTRDRLTPQLAYVVEENIEILVNVRIFHPLVEHYFEHFNGDRYVIRPWLKKVYPHDDDDD